MDLMAKVRDAVATYPGVVVSGDMVRLTNGKVYRLVFEYFEEDKDDPIGDTPFPANLEPPDVIRDHISLMEAIMAYLSAESEDITGFTTDGDGKDCDAIFKYQGKPSILKIR